MTLTVSQILGTRPESLLTAAGDVASIATQLDGQIANQRSHLSRLAGSWTGGASAAAQHQGAEMLVGQEAYRDKLRAMQQVMSAGGQQLTGIRTALEAMTTGGIAPVWKVADDGSVTPGPLLQKYAGMFPTLGMQIQLKAMEIGSAVKKMLAEFEQVDKATAAELRTFAHDDISDKTKDEAPGSPGSGDGDGDGDGAPRTGSTPPGGNPAEIASRFLGRNAAELKGSGALPMDPSVPSDICCANFVSATLQQSGQIGWHSNGVADMSQRLQAEGWRIVPASEARPGDVAIINGNQHTELVYANNGGQIQLIGSNNQNADGTQRITFGNPYGSVMYLSPP